jgi:hypothetical protein
MGKAANLMKNQSLSLCPPICLDDLYDESFTFDAPNGEFLGECGVSVSEIIGWRTQKDLGIRGMVVRQKRYSDCHQGIDERACFQ